MLEPEQKSEGAERKEFFLNQVKRFTNLIEIREQKNWKYLALLFHTKNSLLHFDFKILNLQYLPIFSAELCLITVFPFSAFKRHQH